MPPATAASSAPIAAQGANTDADAQTDQGAGGNRDTGGRGDTAAPGERLTRTETPRQDAAAPQPQLAAGGREAAPERRSEPAVQGPQALTPATAPEASTPEVRAPELPRPMTEMPRMHARLHDLGTKTETAIRLAVRDGHGFARISMRPPELGSIEIRLSYRGGEIVAEVRAENAQTLGVLSQTAADLRRQLESHGIVLSDLQLRQSGGDDATGEEHAGRSSKDRPGNGSAHEADDDLNELAIEAARRHPAAVRLDVLA